MKITELYIYPIKALAPLSVPRARLLRDGVEHDRRYMLLEVIKGSDPKPYQTIHHPEGVVFRQELDGEDIVITAPPPEGAEIDSTTPEKLRVPLAPSSLDRCETITVKFTGSGNCAYRMGADPYDDWFSARLGYPVMLVYIGERGRPVLAHEPAKHPMWRSPRRKVPAAGGGGWLPSISSYVPNILGGGEGEREADDERETLAFNECAPFLVTSNASLRDVSARLPEGQEMDMRRFRPNIVVDDDPSDEAENLKPWDEDYWGELVITGREDPGGHRLALTANCGRCLSINIDYDKGQVSKGELGSVLKTLMRDRRVDDGNKWSPVFGRYAFLPPGDVGRGVEIAVGDDVSVARRLDYRDTWEWPRY